MRAPVNQEKTCPEMSDENIGFLLSIAGRTSSKGLIQ
jgi:hypothetical protein